MYIRRCCARELFMSLDGGFNPSTSVFSFFFKPALLAQTDAAAMLSKPAPTRAATEEAGADTAERAVLVARRPTFKPRVAKAREGLRTFVPI